MFHKSARGLAAFLSQSVASASLCSGGGCDKKTGNGRRNSERIQETHDVTWQAEAVIPLFFCGGGSALHVQSIGIAVYYLRLREHWINIAGFLRYASGFVATSQALSQLDISDGGGASKKFRLDP